jgi:signal transduction histidine kinase
LIIPHKFKPAVVFKNLNNKIISYFIAFAFLPLLVFSILGYYLNKDILNRINNNNLQTVNTNYARQLRLYLEHKQSHLQLLHDRLQPGISGRDLPLLVPDDKSASGSEFVEIQRLAAGDVDQALRNRADKNTVGIICAQNDGTVLVGWVSVPELQNLLTAAVREYRNYIYIMDQSLCLGSAGVASPAELEKTGRRFSDFIADTSNLRPLYDGVTGIFSVTSRLPDFNILLLTEIDARDFYSSLKSFRNKIILANILFAVLIISLGIFYSRQVIKPVNQLVQSVQAMSRGDLHTPISLTTNDQLQLLAEEFERLRQKLQESYQGLEEKIESRTLELRQAQAQISHQEKMASLGLIAAGIAHEIGNPLTSISSMAQVIKRKTSDEKTIEYVNNILKNIERISRIVRELVDFSKPAPHKEVEADINEIVNSAVSIIKYDRRSKKINFQLNLQQELPKTVLVPDHLLQIFLNILINAVDASEGLGSEIAVNTSASGPYLQIDISDRGCGIPPANIRKIFEPFFTTKGVGKGTGLGLTVSYGLINKLQGEIKVRSEINKGSTFSVLLPVRGV